MDNMIIRYWRGWMNAKSMNEPNWMPIWIRTAVEAERENCELIVFKIPRNKKTGSADHQTILEIEKLLQDKFENN